MSNIHKTIALKAGGPGSGRRKENFAPTQDQLISGVPVNIGLREAKKMAKKEGFDVYVYLINPNAKYDWQKQVRLSGNKDGMPENLIAHFDYTGKKAN